MTIMLLKKDQSKEARINKRDFDNYPH